MSSANTAAVARPVGDGTLNLQDLKMTDFNCCKNWPIIVCSLEGIPIKFSLIGRVRFLSPRLMS